MDDEIRDDQIDHESRDEREQNDDFRDISFRGDGRILYVTRNLQSSISYFSINKDRS